MANIHLIKLATFLIKFALTVKNFDRIIMLSRRFGRPNSMYTLKISDPIYHFLIHLIYGSRVAITARWQTGVWSDGTWFPHLPKR